MNLNKQLFELVESKGESLQGDLHIIDHCDELQESYRVYHSKGYCFDVYRQLEEDEFDGTEEYFYWMDAEWDGFKDLTAEKAISLIQE